MLQFLFLYYSQLFVLIVLNDTEELLGSILSIPLFIAIRLSTIPSNASTKSYFNAQI